MITTSYEAYHALDKLREASNLSIEELSVLMGIKASYYRTLQGKVLRQEKGSLNAGTDIKVRSFIAYLIYGLRNSEHLPIISGHPHRLDLISKWLKDAKGAVHFKDFSPFAIYCQSYSETIEDILKLAERFSPQ